MRYYGGPLDGEDVEDEHVGADEIQIQISEYTAQHQLVSSEEHVYAPNGLGVMAYVGPV